MAIKLTDQQIQFNNVTIPSVYVGGLSTTSEYKDQYGNSIDDEYDGNIQQPSPFINAIDIDWNGAKPGIGEDSTKGITTTGELLSRI